MKLVETLALDNLNIPYEKREMALEYINQVRVKRFSAFFILFFDYLLLLLLNIYTGYIYYIPYIFTLQ